MVKNVEMVECRRCGRLFKESGLQGHITAKHSAEIWREQRDRKAMSEIAEASAFAYDDPDFIRS